MGYADIQKRTGFGLQDKTTGNRETSNEEPFISSTM